MEANLCNTLCPRKVLDAAEYREAAVHASLFRRAMIAGAVGVVGIRHALRASSCPQRYSPEGEYVPADSCAEIVADRLRETPISPVLLVESEYAVLKLYMHPDNLFQAESVDR